MPPQRIQHHIGDHGGAGDDPGSEGPWYSFSHRHAFDPITATPEAFADILRGDLVRWGRVVREAKVKPD